MTIKTTADRQAVVDKRFGRFEQTSLLLDIREALEAEITAAS